MKLSIFCILLTVFFFHYIQASSRYQYQRGHIPSYPTEFYRGLRKDLQNPRDVYKIFKIGKRNRHDITSKQLLRYIFNMGKRSYENDLLPENSYLSRRSFDDDIQNSIFKVGRRAGGEERILNAFDEELQKSIFRRGRRSNLFSKMLVSDMMESADTCGCNMGCNYLNAVECIDCCYAY